MKTYYILSRITKDDDGMERLIFIDIFPTKKEAEEVYRELLGNIKSHRIEKYIGV